MTLPVAVPLCATRAKMGEHSIMKPRFLNATEVRRLDRGVALVFERASCDGSVDHRNRSERGLTRTS